MFSWGQWLVFWQQQHFYDLSWQLACPLLLFPPSPESKMVTNGKDPRQVILYLFFLSCLLSLLRSRLCWLCHFRLLILSTLFVLSFFSLRCEKSDCQIVYTSRTIRWSPTFAPFFPRLGAALGLASFTSASVSSLVSSFRKLKRVETKFA